MNLKCEECGATIFTPSGNKEEHERLLSGHMQAIHGDEKSRTNKLLTRCVAALHLIHAHGGVPQVFTKFQAKDLINDISDHLKIPRVNTEVTTTTIPVIPEESKMTVHLMNTENKGKPVKA
jgi:hypothetical protein